MELLKLEKIKDGRYLKNYELTYRNKVGKEKKYEIVSRSEIAGVEAIGKRVSGVSIVAYHEDRMLLLREFRQPLCLQSVCRNAGRGRISGGVHPTGAL